jgi:DNA repair protein RecO (recombination protein O)
MRRVQLEPAYLLSVRAYRETSALLEVFTATHGRTGLVARGTRGPKSKLRGLLQPFQPLLLSWSERGELGTLHTAEAAGAPPLLSGEAVFSGWYLNELLLRLLQRHDPHPALFDAYERTLRALADAGAVRALRLFELELLSELGYGLQVPDDLHAEGWYRYEPDAGLRVAEPGPESYRGTSLLALAEEALDTPESLNDARRLLRQALAPHLGGRALRTPEMLRALRAATGAGK